MGSLNPVLWIFILTWAAVISVIALLIALPVGLTTFFVRRGKTNSSRALRAAGLVFLLTFVLLMIVGCVITTMSIRGPLAL